MKLTPTLHRFPTYEGPNWHFLRAQLGAAREDWPQGEAPPLPLTVREITELRAAGQVSQRPPYALRGQGRGAWDSLRAAVDSGIYRAGPQLLARLDEPLAELSTALERKWGRKDGPDESAWEEVFRPAVEMEKLLLPPEALLHALDDVFDGCERIEDPAGLHVFAGYLDTLRAVGTVQGRPWRHVKATIEEMLTDRASQSGSGELGARSTDSVRHELRVRLGRPLDSRDWAVWIAGRAGPGAAGTRTKTTVAGAIAVCGVPCTGSVATWLSEARAEMSQAFELAGLRVPRDVEELGEAERIRGVVASGHELWADFAESPSFVCRVAIVAVDSTEAVVQARLALGAVLGRDNPRVASDLRADALVWGPAGGWRRPHTTARGMAKGEPQAVLSATRAVSLWGSDLGSQLNAESVRLMRDRAVAADTEASPDVRLMRAATALESIPRESMPVFKAVERLSLRWVTDLAWNSMFNLVHNVALDTHRLGPPAPGREWRDVEEHQNAIRDQIKGPGLELGVTGLEKLRPLFETVHPDAPSQLWMLDVERLFTTPGTIRLMVDRFVAWVRLAQRHRNLVAHGWSLDPAVLLPSASFLARMLEIAITARAEERETGAHQILGSLRHAPSSTWNGQSVDELLAAVRVGGSEPEDGEPVSR